MRPSLAMQVVFAVVLAFLSACAADASRDESPGSALYADPQPVAIEGYDDHAMEPFLSRDGRHLYFNNSNHPPISITPSGSTPRPSVTKASFGA